MPSADSDSPLALALAWVTCPTSFEPLGMITCPSCLTAWVVWAKTLSPSLFFLASSGLSSAASNVVPLEMLAEFCPACAVADVEAEAFAEASVPEPFFSACGGADRSGRSRGGLDSCANAFHASKAPANNTNQIRFICNCPPCSNVNPRWFLSTLSSQFSLRPPHLNRNRVSEG